MEKLELREEELLSSVVRLSTVFSDKLEDEHVHVIVGLVRVSGPQLIRHLVLHLVVADVTYYNAGFVADGLL